MDDVVTKDCIVVVVPRQSPVVMASQNTTSSTLSSSSSNTNMAGAANTAGTAQGQTQTQTSRSSKKPRSTAKPSSSTAPKPAVKKKKAAVATASAPSNASQPSSKAAAAAKQLGLAASACPDPAATASSGPCARKRNHAQAFPPTQDQDRDDVAQLSRPAKEQPQKPEYPRRAAPWDAINQPCFEVMSIYSEDEYSSDSDEPLIEGQKRRINSKASSQSVSQQNTPQPGPQASAQVQGLAKVFHEKEDATKHAARLQKQVDDKAARHARVIAAIRDSRQKETIPQDCHASVIDAIRDSRQKETIPQDASAVRISELERENRHVSEMNVNAKVRYGQLQAKHSMLQNEYDQKKFDHKQLETSHKQLDALNKQWEVENKQLQDEVDRLRQKDRDWQAQWDERMAREKKWGEILGEVAINLYPHMHRGSGGAPL